MSKNKITYDFLFEECKTKTLDYYDKKIEVDFFVECFGVDYYYNLLNVLQDNDYVQKYQNVMLLQNFNEEFIKDCFLYLDKLEKYIKAYLYRNNLVYSLNLLHEKKIKNLYDYLDAEAKKTLFDNDFEITKLLTFKKRVYDSSLLFCSDYKHLIVNFVKALPNNLSDEFNCKVNDYKEKYKPLMRIIEFA